MCVCVGVGACVCEREREIGKVKVTGHQIETEMKERDDKKREGTQAY